MGWKVLPPILPLPPFLPIPPLKEHRVVERDTIVGIQLGQHDVGYTLRAEPNRQRRRPRSLSESVVRRDEAGRAGSRPAHNPFDDFRSRGRKRVRAGRP